MILDGVMTAAEATRQWGLSQATVRNAILQGRLPAVKSDGTWLVKYSDMVALYGEEPAQEGQKGE